MLYQLLKMVMKVALRFFYRHLHVTGLQHVPPQGPAIIIANHPSSLMDAALIGIVMKRPVYFFTRGDVFINPLVNRILQWMHMLPVHNHEKGRHTLAHNDDSFNTAQQVLLKGGIIVFFPESSSHTERQLLPLRKGVFRLAFQTLTAAGFSFDIPVIPVGITYEHPTRARTNVTIKGGPPLLLLPYKEMYRQNPAAALLHISKEAYDRMRQLVLHINDARFFTLGETLLTINRNNQPTSNKPWYIVSDELLRAEQEIFYKINHESAPVLEELNKRAAAYQSYLDSFQLSDEPLSPFFTIPFSSMALVPLYPAFAVGCLLNGLPIAVARLIVKKKVARTDFYSWLYVVIAILLYAGWVLLLAGMVAAFWGWLYGVVLLVAMPASVFFLINCRELLRKNRQTTSLKQLSAAQQGQLKDMRNAISAFI